MTYIDYTHLGGMPIYLNTFEEMQKAYNLSEKAFAELAGTAPHIISGIVNTGGVVSDGVLYYNGEIIPFTGGAVGMTIVINSFSTTYVFANSEIHTAITKKTASFGTGAVQFDYADLKMFQEGFGAAARSEWVTLLDTGTQKLFYCLDKLAGVVHLRGSWSLSSTAGRGDPTVHYQLEILPEEIRPTQQVHFMSVVRSHTVVYKDIYGSVVKGEDCTIFENGTFSMCWRKLVADEGYTQRFNISYPLF